MDAKYPLWLESAALVLLLLNIPIIVLETFPTAAGAMPIHTIEWVFTILFSGEFLLRIAYAESKKRYLLSPAALIDFLAILPQYLLFFFPLAHDLFLLRLLRLFRLIVKGLRAASAGHSVLQRALELREHFAPDEQLLIQTHMTRRHYAHEYAALITLALVLGAGAVLVPSPLIMGIPYLSAACYLFLVAIIILILKKELHVISHRYAVTNYRVLSSTSILEHRVTSISLPQVTDISLHQSLIGRILGTGSIVIRTSGEVNAMDLQGIKEPIQIKQLIQQAMMRLNPSGAVR